MLIQKADLCRKTERHTRSPSARRRATEVVLIAPDPRSINHFIPSVKHKGGTLELLPDSRIDISNLSSSPCPGCSNENPYRSKINRQTLVDLLGSKKGRYAISLPKPDSYEEGVRERSKVGTVWWKDCYPACSGSSKIGLYTTQVILHYKTKDSQGFNVDHNGLDFVDHDEFDIFMNPKGAIDDCDSGGRLAFKELVGLFSLKLYVDLQNSHKNYPSDDDPEDCLGSDPQNPSNTTSLELALELLGNYVIQPVPADAAQARTAWAQVNHAHNLVSMDERIQFERSMTKLDEFLKRVEAHNNKVDSSSTAQALKGIRTVRQSIFHDGSGACRNPLLALSY
jgi:hypothetical protein